MDIWDYIMLEFQEIKCLWDIQKLVKMVNLLKHKMKKLVMLQWCKLEHQSYLIHMFH